MSIIQSCQKCIKDDWLSSLSFWLSTLLCLKYFWLTAPLKYIYSISTSIILCTHLTVCTLTGTPSTGQQGCTNLSDKNKDRWTEKSIGDRFNCRSWARFDILSFGWCAVFIQNPWSYMYTEKMKRKTQHTIGRQSWGGSESERKARQ